MIACLLLLFCTPVQDRLVETVRIGTVTGDPTYEFYRVVRVETGPAGEIFVANAGFTAPIPR